MNFSLGDDGQGQVYTDNNNKVHFTGIINDPVSCIELHWWGASPIERRTSYSGSGLPYPNPDIAYEKTVNQGKIKLNNNKFDFVLHDIPNSYYVANGTIYVHPTINIRVVRKTHQKQYNIELGQGVPFRHLTWSGQPNVEPRSSALFYNTRFSLPFDNQEGILRRSAYPEQQIMPEDFWGLAVPNQ